MKKHLCIVCILTAFYSFAYSQCADYFVCGRSTADIKYNYPNFTLKKNLNNIIQKENIITLIIDTSKISLNNIFDDVIQYKSNQSNFRFTHFYKDSFGYDSALLCVNMLRDNINNKTYYLTTSLNRYEIYSQNAYYLENCFVLFHLSVDKKFVISVFSYKTLTTSTFNIWFPIVVGYSDSSIFIQTISDTKINKKKIKTGSILSVNENGFEIYKDKPMPYIYSYKSSILFLSNKYSVNRKFIKEIHNDCKTLEINLVYIKNQTDVIDSFHYDFRPWGTDINIDYNSDKLILDNSNSFFKVYDKEKIVYDWESTSWLDSLKILQLPNRSFFYYNDILFLEFVCSESYALGLTPDKTKTLNNIPFDKTATDYKLIIAFDLKTKSFLGYPKITFHNGDK
jgi:hypothetical protein